MDTVTISIGQLCRKLKKINNKFEYEFINQNEDWSADHATDDLSPAKKQRLFCERMFSDIITWQ